MQGNHNISHNIFKGFISEQTTSLRASCDDLKVAVQNIPDIQEDLMGEVDVAVGQSELLIRERFKQFARLIDDSEFKRSEKEITLEDLQGFWDIILIQVDNIKQKINNVKNRNDKKQSSPLKEKAVNGNVVKAPRKVPAIIIPKKNKTESVGKTNIRNHILALRKEMKQKGDINNDVIFATTEKNKENVESAKEISSNSNTSLTVPDVKIFDAGFFNVQSPVRSATKRTRNLTTTSPVSNIPTSVLSSSALKKKILLSPMNHKDYSPCSRITRSMKKLIDSNKE